MEKFGVVSKVDTTTDWCAGMVVVPKSDERIRICVDLTKLNEGVLRKTYPLPKIKNLLAQISESKFFTKLDCNSGFWQEKLPLFDDVHNTIWQILFQANAIRDYVRA